MIDLDQTIFVPIIDESKGGVKYEVEMTVAEMFDKFFEGVQPEIVDAIPVKWLKEYQLENQRQGNYDMVGAIEVTMWDWEKEQGIEPKEG